MVPAFRILIIEDDPAVARSLQAGLERSSFTVQWRSSGEAGLASASSDPPHLILLDVRLPDGSGFDFCRRMRQIGLKQPVIMLTVQNEETDKVLGLEMGADDYVTKPYALRELISRIRAQLRRAYGEYAAGQGELLFVQDLILDLTRAQVRRQEQVLNLTPIEFRLLSYLARHPGQVFTRTQILEAVWGYAADLDGERTVNVQIRRLREKIEADPGRPQILLTVPGIGYRLVA